MEKATLREELITLEDVEKSKKEYSDDSFWEKLRGYAKKAGCGAVYAALLLYYALSDENVPAKSKAIIYGALGYFILPFDFIPDAIPAGGFVDDYTALMLAIGAVAMFIGEETKAKAKQKLFEWFEGGCDSEEIQKVDSKI